MIESYSQEEIEVAFDMFVKGAQRVVSDYMEEAFPTLTPKTLSVDKGRKYWKVVVSSGGLNHSVFGFVRKSDGAIFKSASWKAPYTKGDTAIRGYVTDHSGGMEAVTPYGIVYVR